NCFRTQRQGEIKILSHFESKETLGRNSNDFERVIGNSEFVTNDVLLPTKLSLPESVTDDDSRGATTAHVVTRIKDATTFRRHTEYVEEVAAYPQCFCKTRLSALCQI